MEEKIQSKLRKGNQRPEWKINKLTHQDVFDPHDLTRLRCQLYRAYKDEEAFWQNKSKVMLLKVGDINSKFFSLKS